MYCEEIDWAWRLHRAGWRVQCVPAAHVVHLAGQATGQIRAESVRRLWRSRLLLVEKYYPGWKRLAARWIIRTGMQRLARRARRIPDASPELAAAYREVAEWA
jgi:GT2 family glycosyltransferase